jgi:hypothetical protein
MSSRDAQLCLRLPSAVKSALAAAASKDQRTVTSMVERIVAEWLRRRGWLKEDAT